MWWVIAMIVGCGGDLPEPRPSAMEPDHGYVGDDVVVTITGREFYPQVEVDATNGDRADVNPGYTARLIDDDGRAFTLESVTLVDYRHLQGIVGRGLDPGTYDLSITGPTGRTGLLADAWTATATRADRLRVDSDQLVYEVYDTAEIEVELVDPAGERVLDDVPLVIVVTSDEGAVDVQFAPGSLEDQTPFSNGFGIQGRLGDDGIARIALTVATPLTVDVIVTPTDPDSGVAEGVLKLLFEPGSERTLKLDLPAEPHTAVAGVPFPVQLTLLDQFGNPVTGAAQTVLLKNVCDSWVDVVSLSDTTTVQVVLEEVTGTPSCPVDRLVTLSGPEGQSSDFDVVAGPVARFEVQATPASVVAGTSSLNAFIRPVDAFGNAAAWRPQTLRVSDTLDGVVAADCVGTVTVLCEVTPTKAGAGVELLVEDEDGVNGRSNAYTVRPAAAAALAVSVFADPAVAGEPVAVTVVATDAFGNALPGSAFQASEFVVTVPGDSPECVAGTSADPNVVPLSCVLTLAQQAVLTVHRGALTASSSAFEVVNGPLAAVVVTPQSATVQAGVGLPVRLRGQDAFGNAYVRQTDAVIALADTSGTASVTSATLGAAGTVDVTEQFTAAGPTTLVASQGGADLGSAALTVLPGPATRLQPAIAVDWVWTGAAVPVTVEALDAFDNRATWTAEVTLTAASSHAGPASVAVTDGLGAATLTWTAPDLAEQLAASGPGGVIGSSAAFPVLADCPSGPTAAVAFGGHADAVACLVGGAASIVGSFAGSTPGTASIAYYGLYVDGARGSSTSTPAATVVLDRAGSFAGTAVVADTSACGSEIAFDAAVGPDDGSPVGRVALVAVDGAIPVGLGSTLLSVQGVTDCSRDVAAGSTLRVRTDRGDLVGAAPTGSGLAIALDASGDGAVTLSAQAEDTGGLATVTVWVPSGAVTGSAAVLLQGDDRRPVVWEQSPWGVANGTVDTVTIWTSEPLLAGDVQPARFSVVGPSATAVVAASLTAPDEITLTLDPPVDADAGIWTVTAAQDLRDLAGNKLDGAWTGAASPWTGTFGAVPVAVAPVTGCATTTPVIRPDGDDGAGAEADLAVVTFTSALAPAAWWLTVTDGAGVVWRERVAVLGVPDAIVWDGRASTGEIVDNGDYDVTVRAGDVGGNLGGGCAVTVTVDNAP